MKKTLVYDWPTRIFHWLFAGLFVAAFFIAKTFDDESSQYPYHMLLGITLAFVVVLRIIWGFVGSRHARFSSFILNPLDLVKYFKGVLSAKPELDAGHNPASSWAAIVMMALALGLAFTGIMMAQDINKDFYEEVHELFANAFIVVVILHIAGVVLHTLKFRDAIGMSMVDGKKKLVEQSRTIENTHAVIGGVLIVAVGLFVLFLGKNYDLTTQNLNLFGKQLQLGESENEEDEGNGAENKSEEDTDHGDDDHD